MHGRSRPGCFILFAALWVQACADSRPAPGAAEDAGSVRSPDAVEPAADALALPTFDAPVGADGFQAPDAAGAACAACPKIRRGATTCNGTRCVVTCPPSFKVCADRCMPSDYNCSESCGGFGTPPITCGQTCVADTPNSCCSRKELCGPFECRDNRCLTTCISNADCAPPQTCDAASGQCGPCGGLGQPCCFDRKYQDYECTGDDLYCNNMTCAKVPPGS